jgi:hypothetical protein
MTRIHLQKQDDECDDAMEELLEQFDGYAEWKESPGDLLETVDRLLKQPARVDTRLRVVQPD